MLATSTQPQHNTNTTPAVTEVRSQTLAIIEYDRFGIKISLPRVITASCKYFISATLSPSILIAGAFYHKNTTIHSVV